jgi:hypothetical protein
MNPDPLHPPGYLDEPPPEPRRLGCSVLTLAIIASAVLLAAIVTLLAGTWRPVGSIAAPRNAPDLPAQSGAPRTWVGGSGVALRDQALPRPAVLSRINGSAAVSPVALASTPAPSGAVGTARYSASATWCAPTKSQCTRWGGNAKLAAVHSFRFGDEPFLARVTRGSASVTVLVVSYCACRNSEHAIDLSPAAFKVLAPLSRGRVAVVVEWPAPEPPRTDADLRMQREVDDAVYR